MDYSTKQSVAYCTMENIINHMSNKYSKINIDKIRIKYEDFIEEKVNYYSGLNIMEDEYMSTFLSNILNIENKIIKKLDKKYMKRLY